MQLNFENDFIAAFGESVNLMVTKYGHYVVPVTNFKPFINDISNTKRKVTLTVKNVNLPATMPANFTDSSRNPQKTN